MQVSRRRPNRRERRAHKLPKNTPAEVIGMPNGLEVIAEEKPSETETANAQEEFEIRDNIFINTEADAGPEEGPPSEEKRQLPPGFEDLTEDIPGMQAWLLTVERSDVAQRVLKNLKKGRFNQADTTEFALSSSLLHSEQFGTMINQLQYMIQQNAHMIFLLDKLVGAVDDYDQEGQPAPVPEEKPYVTFITNDEQHKAALARLAELMEHDPPAESRDGQELIMLATSIEDYERTLPALAEKESPTL